MIEAKDESAEKDSHQCGLGSVDEDSGEHASKEDFFSEYVKEGQPHHYFQAARDALDGGEIANDEAPHEGSEYPLDMGLPAHLGDSSKWIGPKVIRDSQEANGE
jgi:hypothetical protein